MSPLSPEFEAHMRAEFPHLAESAIFMSLVPPASSIDDPAKLDVQFCCELGAAIMLNKPILVAAMPGRPVPPGLSRVAHAVVEADLSTAAGKRRFGEATVQFVEEFAGGH